ncbi:hypothetical protein ACP275_10G065700 [Erythranthe tilingii]
MQMIMHKDASSTRGKRVIRTDSNLPPDKKKFANRSFVGVDGVDRISHLPVEVRIHILSMLSLKEAARTSVLSFRWLNLWKHTSSLDFDADIESDMSQSELIDSAGPKFVQMVNRVVESHKSLAIKEFKINFPLDASYTNSITRWLEFAFSRHVQRLELHLDDDPEFRNYDSCSCYPEQLLARSNMILDFQSLKELSFKNVQLSGGAIEFFIHNCTQLERLIVDSPGKYVSKLEVCGSSLVLKHLEIVSFVGLESLKIFAPRLTSLRLTSLKGVLLEIVPMLVDVCVGSTYDDLDCLKNLIHALSCCFSQLETLKLVMPRFPHEQENDELCNFPEMPKLKKLVVEYDSFDDDKQCFMRLASLTRASPQLQEFVLNNKRFGSGISPKRVDNDGAAIIKFRHEHLKVFKFCGYYGRPSHDALVEYILKNCVVLEKIIIVPCAPEYCPDGFDRYILSVEEATRKKAKLHLEPHLPHHVQLIIL